MNGLIEIIAGTLGGGKSMCAAERAYWHLERGAYCFTNVEMFPDKIEQRMAERGYKYDPERLTILDGKSLRDFHRQISRGTADSQVLVMLDEAHLEWNSRDYQSTRKDPRDREMLTFITLCRKLDIILLFITQSPEDIDKQLRKKANLLWMCRNFRHYKIMGLIPFPIPVFTRVCFDIAVGNAKPVKQHSEVFLRPSWACELYNSDALLGEAADQFANMKVVSASPLERIPKRKRVKKRKPSTIGWAEGLLIVSSCVLCFV
ncbi:zonular occludens toxin domain-containing protein [Synoicihabitans lomoniglobus]|nr:zonular occludens toxin domain-containing protein [Opitutaceae bacterium LMO-M01]